MTSSGPPENLLREPHLVTSRLDQRERHGHLKPGTGQIAVRLRLGDTVSAPCHLQSAHRSRACSRILPRRGFWGTAEASEVRQREVLQRLVTVLGEVADGDRDLRHAPSGARGCKTLPWIADREAGQGPMRQRETSRLPGGLTVLTVCRAVSSAITARWPVLPSVDARLRPDPQHFPQPVHLQGCIQNAPRNLLLGFVQVIDIIDYGS